MLKLEKSSLFSPLRYRFREREGWFGSQFLKAFGMAALFHAGFFLLFRIHPFFHSSSFLFPPVQVELDLLSSFTNVGGAAEGVQEEDFLFPVFPVLSFVPDLPWEGVSLHSDRPLDLHAFQHVEERMWPIEYAPLSLPLEEHKIELSVSGDLAEEKLIQTDSRLLERQPLSFRSPLLVSYQVERDERSGEIFWYERKESSGRKEIDDLTEEILLNLKFATEKKEMTGGMLHFKIFDIAVEVR